MAKAFGAAFRNLRRAPAFAGLVVLTLALGIGATTAMFSVVDAVLLRSLPYPGIERFAEIHATLPGPIRSSGIPGAGLSVLRKELGDIAAVEGFQMGSATITGGREPDIVSSPRVTPHLLVLVGATPHLGRLFNDDDLLPPARNVIISHQLWATNFGGAPDIIGRRIDLDDEKHVVIGVMSPRVRYPEASAAIWRPLDLAATGQSRRRVQVVSVRFPGVTEDQFAARLRTIEDTLHQTKALPPAQTLESALLLQERFARQDSRGLWLMFGAVTLVLLVACVNVSNMLLARASRQHAEIALRSALGATRKRLIGSSLTESLLLAIASGAIGVAIARVLMALLLQILPPQLTYLTARVSEIDLRVLLFALVVSLLTCVLSGLLPAMRASKIDPLDAIKQHGQTVLGKRNEWWQSALLAGQMSLVLVLLAGAGLLLRSFVKLSNVDVGFEVDGLSLVNVELAANHYAPGGAALRFAEDAEQRLEATGTMQLAIASGPPVFGVGVQGNINPEAEGGIERDFTGQILPQMQISSDYFSTLGIPVLAGRSFTAADGDAAVIINDRLATHYWGDASPIGRRFRLSGSEPWKTVVGVAGDVRQMNLTDPLSHGMEIYFPLGRQERGGSYTLLVRSDRAFESVTALVKQLIWSMDARIPISATPMSVRIGESLARQRFFVRLSTAFTLIAVALAMIGVYATTSYWVERRRREMAIRLAIGASPNAIVASVITRSARVAVAGTMIGLVIAVAGSRVIRAMLFATEPWDPVTLAAVTGLLLVVAVAACLAPALRAAHLDPMTTLRSE